MQCLLAFNLGYIYNKFMKSYAEIKEKLVANKDKFIFGGCFVLVFVVGFGAGRFDRDLQKTKAKSQPNYTTKSAPVQTTAAKEEAVPGPLTQVQGTATTTAPATCIIKGNINSKGGKIYHIPGGASYKITKPEQCFNTEAEAVAAGFVKASR
jgi:hypothetical protein